jgi:uncharacterized coiled-coil protein SlyX
MSTPSEQLLATVVRQAETIHLQAETIAALTEELAQMRAAALADDPDAEPGTYLDGTPR